MFDVYLCLFLVIFGLFDSWRFCTQFHIYSVNIFSDCFFDYNSKYIPHLYYKSINNRKFSNSLLYTMQFNRKTVLHGLVFLLVQCFPIIVGVSVFYTQNNACSADPMTEGGFCFFPSNTTRYAIAVILLAFLILFSVIYCVFLYYFWTRNIWPTIHKQTKSKSNFINGK